jgi:hypothetical protein
MSIDNKVQGSDTTKAGLWALARSKTLKAMNKILLRLKL